ncbi:MAG: hypothetical protein ACP6IS_02520 [Candidatus Asgardarchaeia archaeon]
MITEILQEIETNLIMLWNITILIGNFAGILSIALGFIFWGTGYDTRAGKKLIVGGIILFLAINYLSSNPPLIVTLLESNGS